jgi:hypothetical protein
VLVARPSGHAWLIWDATDAVVGIVKNKTAAAAANDQLERGAIKALSDNLKDVSRSAKDISVNVVFKKIGAINPEYGTPTYAGVYQYATLKVQGRDAFTRRAVLKNLAPSAPIPPWVKFTIAGSLPPG